MGGRGHKTCLGAVRLALEGASHRRRTFGLDTLISSRNPHPVRYRLSQTVTHPQTSPNENAGRKTDQGFSAGRMLAPAPNRRLTYSLGMKPGLVIK
jgi:hypothetical protein